MKINYFENSLSTCHSHPNIAKKAALEERLDNQNKLYISLHPCNVWIMNPAGVESEDEPKLPESNMTSSKLKYLKKKKNHYYQRLITVEFKIYIYMA